jgi:hypothetical protein
MAYVPGFDHDVFISYAHVNNPIPHGEQMGWVSSFLSDLENQLKQEVQEYSAGLKVWIDERRIGGSDVFDDVIAKDVRNSAVLISILSRGYLSSTYCRAELNEFCAHNVTEINVNGSTKKRAVKVLLQNLPSTAHPLQLQGMDGYEFFSVDQRTESEFILPRRIRGEPNQAYQQKITSLAQNLAAILDKLRSESAALAQPGNKPIVYLAEVTDNLVRQRMQIKGMLEQRGVTVVSSPNQSPDAYPLEAKIRQNLGKARFYIHLLGDTPRFVSSENDLRSLSELQHKTANEIGTTKKIERIVWIKPGFEIETVQDEEHKAFLNTLVSEPNTLSPLEVTREESLEKLKDFILAKVSPQSSQQIVSPLDEPASVYISHLPEDKDEAQLIKQVLRQARHNVFLSLDTEDEEEQERDDTARLKWCDAVLVLYGRDNRRLLVRDRIENVLDISKERRDNPILVKSLCDGPPVPKRDLGVGDLEGWVSICCQEGIQSDNLEPFINRLKNSRR